MSALSPAPSTRCQPVPAKCSLKDQPIYTLAAIAIDTLRQSAGINSIEHKYGDIVHDAPIEIYVGQTYQHSLDGMVLHYSRDATPWRGFPRLVSPDTRLANPKQIVVSDSIIDIVHRLIARCFRLFPVVDRSCSGFQRGDAFNSSSEWFNARTFHGVYCLGCASAFPRNAIPRGKLSSSCARPKHNTTTLRARQQATHSLKA